MMRTETGDLGWENQNLYIEVGTVRFIETARI